MTNRLLIFTISALVAFCPFAASGSKSKLNRYKIKKLVNEVSEKELVGHLRKFVRCCRPNRMVGSDSHAKVYPYLKSIIEKVDKDKSGSLTVDEYKVDAAKGMKIYQDDFNKEILGKFEKTEPTYIKWRGFTDSMVGAIKKRKDVKGHNLIWEKKGSVRPDDIIVIGAHFDTIANDPKTLQITPNVAMPGADDNGSGVAIALALVELFTKIDTPVTVRIVFFDWEELGFLGSYAYVTKYSSEFKKKNFLGYVNLEMLGHDSTTEDKTKKLRNMRIYTRNDQKDLLLANSMMSWGKKAGSGAKFEIIKNSFNSSDHINFWEANLTAITFSQDWENDFNHKRYHGPNDFVETINAKTFYKAYQFIANGLLGHLFNAKS